MSVTEIMSGYVGSWKGVNHLYLGDAPEQHLRSDSTMSVSLKANGQIAAFDYRWEYESEPQEGLILLGCDPKSGAAQTIWTDSFHSRNAFIVSDGKFSAGMFSVKGYYKVAGYPDWGWRTDINPKGDTLKITMYNVSPEGIEEFAVETEFFRE